MISTVVGRCVVIDLNIGCPQRTAYLGHFGSYLLGKEDRDLVISIVRGVVRTGECRYGLNCGSCEDRASFEGQGRGMGRPC